MRFEFKQIVSGWRADEDTEELVERIRMAERWAEENAPLEADEKRAIEMMREFAYRRDDYSEDD